jgi:hypothetical protein
MQVTFNGQERTLREIVALALSARWKVVRVTKAPGSLFGHIVAVPVAVPVSPQRRARRERLSALRCTAPGQDGRNWNAEAGEMEMVERSSRRRRLRVDLPSVAEARAVWQGRCRYATAARRFAGSAPTPPLKRAVVLTGPPVRKKMPSPLSVAPPPSSPSPNLASFMSPRPPPAQQQQQQHASAITRRIPQAPLRTQSQQLQPPAPLPVPRQPSRLPLCLPASRSAAVRRTRTSHRPSTYEVKPKLKASPTRCATSPRRPC